MRTKSGDTRGRRERTRKGGLARRTALGGLILAAGLQACTQSEPTSISEELIPTTPQTVEVLLPWSAFGDSIQVFGGFGRSNDLARRVISNQFRGTLDARFLARFNRLPQEATVRDTAGESRVDLNLSLQQGRIVATLDTLRSIVTGPVQLSVGYLDQEWDPASTGWGFRVDTIQNREEWPEPGAGPVVPLATATWDPAQGDSVVFPLDSAQLRLLDVDPDSVEVRPSVRLEVLDADQRLEVTSVLLRGEFIPSLNPDTSVVLTAIPNQQTFIYTPEVAPPASGIRAGGAPSWRTVIYLRLPAVLDGPAELCALVECPFTLTPGRLNHASLILTSRATEPVAFQPADSLLLDLRPVLVPGLLPKSPLGSSLLALSGLAAQASAFQGTGGVEIPITITDLVRDQVDPEEEDVPSQVAFLSLVEPFSLAFAEFDGPGDPGEPRLRLILTDVPPLELR